MPILGATGSVLVRNDSDQVNVSAISPCVQRF